MTTIESAAFCLVLFLTVTILSLLYWQVVRPVFLLRQQYRLYAVRDDLRRLAMDNQVSSGHFLYNYLDELVNKGIVIFPTVSVWTILRLADAKPSEKMQRFNKDASPELLELRKRISYHAARIILLNSPIFLGIAIVCTAARKFRRAFVGHPGSVEISDRELQKAENFASCLPTPVKGGEPCLATA